MKATIEVIKGMSTTPPLECQLPRVNKFVGEVFGVLSNTRTIYAGTEHDTIKRDTRVILLLGPNTSGKSSLIDFFCNYFYGAELDNTTRYHIANEKFDKTTPEKDIITYIFNDSVMDVRPVLIDTPPTSGPHGESNRQILAQWLKDSDSLELDAIGVVFCVSHRITTAEEEGLQKALELFPLHLRQKCVVFMVGSDGSSPPIGMLRRFNLERADVYKVNTSCIFQRPEDEPLQEHLRGNYWRMSVANFNALFSRLNYKKPVVHSFTSHGGESSVMLHSPGTSSYSSRNSPETVIRRDSNMSGVEPQSNTMMAANQSSTMKSMNAHKVAPSSLSKQVVIEPGYSRKEPGYNRSSESTKCYESRHITSIYEYEYTIPVVADIRTKESHQPSGVRTSSDPKTDVTCARHQLIHNNTTSTSDESKTVIPLERSRNFDQAYSDKASKPRDDDIKRYVFDTSTRNHRLLHGEPVAHIKSNSTSPRVLRETTIDEPYIGPPKEALISARHSWHDIHQNNLASNPISGPHQKRGNMETLIDFRSPVDNLGVFHRNDSARRSRHASGTRSRSVEPEFFAQPVEIHRASADNSLIGLDEHFETQIRRAAIDMRENPVFSLRGTENNRMVPNASDTRGSFFGRERAVQPYISASRSNERNPLPPYSTAMRALSLKASEKERRVDNEEMRMSRPEEMLKRTKKNFEREYYPNGEPLHQGNAASSIPYYDQCPDTDKNDDITPRHMRSNDTPLIAQEQLNKKPNAEGQLYPLEDEELYQNRHYSSDFEKDPAKGKPTTSLPLPPYVPRQPQRATQLSSEQILRGDVEYGGGETRLLKDLGFPKVKTKNSTTTRKSSTHQPRQIRFLKWTPSNCSNTRDCCLNCLCFVVAPLVVFIIITAIIITLATG